MPNYINQTKDKQGNTYSIYDSRLTPTENGIAYNGAFSVSTLTVDGKTLEFNPSFSAYFLNGAGEWAVPVSGGGSGLMAGTGLLLSVQSDINYINHINSIASKSSAEQSGTTLTWGASFSVYEHTYDNCGHIQSTATETFTLPSNPDYVHQVKTTADANLPILLKNNSASTSSTAQVKFATPTINPNTGLLSTSEISVDAITIGGHKIFIQSTQPTSGMSSGDIWFQV